MFRKRRVFESFKKLGLTEYETEAYLTLLAHGPLSPSRLSSASKIPRPRVYDVLKGLASRGIILEKPGKPTMYSPVEIDKVMSILESEAKDDYERKLSLVRKEGKSLIKQLKGQKPKRIDRVFVFNNTKNLINWFRVSAKDAKKYIHILDSFDRGIMPRAFRNYLDFGKRMHSKNVKVRYCLPIERWNAEEIKKLSKFIEVKHLLKTPDVGFYIIDGKQVMVTTSAYPKATYDNGILIKDPAIINMEEEYFDTIWENSIPVNKRVEEIS